MREHSPIIGLTVMLAIAIGLYLLARGLAERSATAYLILGGLITLGIGVLFVFGTLAIILFANRIAERREMREQTRFIDNAKENLALMQMTAKTQATQNAMLLRQARESQRQLPAPNDMALDVDALLVDDTVFEELG